jgi:hypothetical protein
MEKQNMTDGNQVFLRRQDKQCHVVVTPKMHLALQMYAEKNGLSLCTATEKLLKLSFETEMIRQREEANPEIAEIRKMIRDLGKPGM